MGIRVHLLFSFCLQHIRVTLVLGPIYSCRYATSTCLYALSHRQFLWMNRHGFPSFARKFSAIFSTSFWWMSNHLSALFVAFFGIVCYKKVPAFQTCCKNFCKFWLPRSLLFPSRCVQARGQGPHQVLLSSDTNIRVCIMQPHRAGKNRRAKNWNEKNCAFQGAAPLALEMTAKRQ